MTIGRIEIAVFYRCRHMAVQFAEHDEDARDRRRRASEILCDVCEELRLAEHRKHRIRSFTIHQTKEHHMALVLFAPGNTAGFTATAAPEGSAPAAGNPVNWTSSDPTNAPVVANPNDPSGLTASVTFPSSATVGTSFVLTAEYLNADGNVASGSFSGTIVEAPPPPVTDITSFTIEQTT